MAATGVEEASAPGISSGRWLSRQAPGTLVPGMAALAIVQATIIIAQAWLLAAILGTAIAQETSPGESTPMLLLLLVILIGRAAVETMRGVLAAGASARVRRRLRPLLFRRMAEAGPGVRGRAGSGALAATLIEQVDALDPWFARFQPQVITVVVVIPAILLVTYFHDWLAGLLLMLAMPLIPLFMVLIGMGAETLSQRQQLALSRLGGTFLDRLRGLDTIRRFGAENHEVHKVATRIEDFRVRTMAVLKLAFLSTAVLEFFSAVAIATVAIYIGLGLLGYIEFGPAAGLDLQVGLFVLLLAPELFLPLRQLSQFWHDRADALAAADRIREVLDLPQARPEPSEPVAAPLRGACRVETRQLRLAYAGSGQVLDNIDLAVEPGQRVLIAGPSGSGKSTLMHILAGFVAPDAGRVTVNGVDLTDIRQSDLARLRGWMGQQPGLIDGSIEDNIALGCAECSRQAIVEATELAGIGRLVRRLPEGLVTEITQDGEGLSGGEVRRVALARTLVRPRPLLLLDEPTASLDPQTAKSIWKTLNEIARQRELTIICASHDPAARPWANRLFTLVAGRLTEGRP